MIGSLFVATEQDRIKAQEVERRRQAELERRSRIFDPKTRIIGVDKNGLDLQVSEKNNIKYNEQKSAEMFNIQMEKNRQMAEALAAQEAKAKQQVMAELNDFRRSFQQKAQRREFDLYDPKYLKNQPPLRNTDDETIPISSGLKFEGEDLSNEQRQKAMKEQRMSWLEQQIKEKQAAKDLEKMSDSAFNKIIFSREQTALRLELAERKCKQMLEAANDRFNMILAMERSSQKCIEVEEETQDNQAEIYNNLTSDLMLENPNAAQSSYGPHRKITYMYKGMSPEEKSHYRKQQLDQIAQKMANLEQKRKMEEEWDKLFSNFKLEADRNFSDRSKQLREKTANLRHENYLLSLEQKQRQKIMNKILTSNDPTEDFFNKFGTSTR